MKKVNWRCMICIGICIVITICAGIILCIIIQQRKQAASEADHEEIQDITWYDFNPIDFDADDILSITYIKDRSDLGEDTNLCWFIDDKIGIHKIMDCIMADTAYIGYFDRDDEPDGNKAIVLWFELSDGTYKKLIYTDVSLTYEDNTYRIISTQDKVEKAQMDILKDYQSVEIRGTDNPYRQETEQELNHMNN